MHLQNSSLLTTDISSMSLVDIENIITESLTFVGMCLKEIRDSGKWKEGGYSTWDDYLDTRWDMSRATAARKIKHFDIQNQLPPGIDVSQNQAVQLAAATTTISDYDADYGDDDDDDSGHNRPEIDHSNPLMQLVKMGWITIPQSILLWNELKITDMEMRNTVITHGISSHGFIRPDAIPILCKLRNKYNGEWQEIKRLGYVQVLDAHPLWKATADSLNLAIYKLDNASSGILLTRDRVRDTNDDDDGNLEFPILVTNTSHIITTRDQLPPILVIKGDGQQLAKTMNTLKGYIPVLMVLVDNEDVVIGGRNVCTVFDEKEYPDWMLEVAELMRS